MLRGAEASAGEEVESEMLTEGEKDRLEVGKIGDNHVLLQLSRCQVGGSADIQAAEGVGLLVARICDGLKLRSFLHSCQGLSLV